MKLYLSLIDDALRSLTLAHEGFVKLYERDPAKRDPHDVNESLRHLYLGTEKLLKHALASIDPYLTLEKPDANLIRDLNKEMRSTDAPTIFASRVPFRTLVPTAVWPLLLDVVNPDLSDAVRDQFAGTLKELAKRRNQAQHGELHGDSADFLAIMEQLFSQLLGVTEAVSPDTAKLMAERLPDFVMALKAAEKRVDAGWLRLVEATKSRGEIVFPLRAYVTLRGPDQNVEFVITADRDTAANSLSCFSSVAIDGVTGLFRRMLSPDQQRARSAERRDTLPIQDISDEEIPAPPHAPRGLLQIQIKPDPIAEALRIKSEKERLATERFGLKTLEPGRIAIPELFSWAVWSDEPAGEAKSSARGVIKDCELAFSVEERQGVMRGKLYPNPQYSGSAEVTPLDLAGPVWLTGEYVVEEGTANDKLPQGAIFRTLRGELAATVDSSDANVDA